MERGGDLAQALEAFRRGELKRARSLAEQGLAAASSPPLQHLLGLVHCRLGKPAKGVEHLRAAAKADPGNAGFQLMLIRALIDAGEPGEVLAMAEPPPPSSPGALALWQARAEACEQAGELEAAAHAWRTIASAAPDDRRAWVNLGRSLLRMERFREAEVAYREALAIASQDDEAIYELALVYDRTNQLDRMAKLLDEAQSAGIASDRLALPRAIREQREGRIENARRLLALPGAARDPVRWNRLRSRLADEAGDAAEAFEAAEAMNRATPGFESWRRRGAMFREQLRHLALTIGPEWAASLTSIGAADAMPVFLLGFPRSGTTLLDTFLMGHPEIAVVEEEPLLFTAIDPIRAVPELGSQPASRLVEIRESYCAALRMQIEPGFAGVAVDKFPLNLIAAPVIHHLFPSAPILFVQRHPCDSVLSCFMQAFSPNAGMASFLDIADAADCYDAVMSVWTTARETLPLNAHIIVYEELVTDPEAVLRSVIRFLGLDWEPGLLDHRATARAREPIANTSYDQVIAPLNARAVGRWKRYETQLDPVLPVLLPWAERLGYRA